MASTVSMASSSSDGRGHDEEPAILGGESGAEFVVSTRRKKQRRRIRRTTCKELRSQLAFLREQFKQNLRGKRRQVYALQLQLDQYFVLLAQTREELTQAQRELQVARAECRDCDFEYGRAVTAWQNCHAKLQWVDTSNESLREDNDGLRMATEEIRSRFVDVMALKDHQLVESERARQELKAQRDEATSQSAYVVEELKLSQSAASEYLQKVAQLKAELDNERTDARTEIDRLNRVLRAKTEQDKCGENVECTGGSVRS